MHIPLKELLKLAVKKAKMNHDFADLEQIINKIPDEQKIQITAEDWMELSLAAKRYNFP